MIALALLAAASTFHTTGFVAGWEMVQGSAGECGAAAQFHDSTLFLITLAPGEETARVAVANAAWRSIQPGQRYSVRVSLNGKAIDITGTGAEINTLNAIRVDINRGEIIRALFMRNPISFDVDGTKLFRMTANSNDPVYALTQCAKGASDPLAR